MFKALLAKLKLNKEAQLERALERQAKQHEAEAQEEYYSLLVEELMNVYSINEVNQIISSPFIKAAREYWSRIYQIHMMTAYQQAQGVKICAEEFKRIWEQEIELLGEAAEKAYQDQGKKVAFCFVKAAKTSVYGYELGKQLIL